MDKDGLDERRKNPYSTSYSKRTKGLLPHKRGLKSPRQKGNQYERELAAWFTEQLGIDVFRTPLSGGGCGFGRRSIGPTADLSGLPDLHVEAKRTERFSPREALLQCDKSINKSFSADMAVVINRPGHTPTGDSICVLRLRDFVKIYSAYLDSMAVKRSLRSPPDLPESKSVGTTPPPPPVKLPEEASTPALPIDPLRS